MNSSKRTRENLKGAVKDLRNRSEPLEKRLRNPTKRCESLSKGLENVRKRNEPQKGTVARDERN